MSDARLASVNGLVPALRIAARVAALGALALVCVPLHYAWRAAGARSPWPQRFLGRAGWISGVRTRIIGTPLRHDVFFVANHLSWTDVCILGGITGTAFVAQDKIAAWPVIGWLANLNATLYVSRTERRTAGDQVARLATALAGDQPLTLFPEGTTTDGTHLLPFKSVLFEGLAPPPRPLRIQPVLLDFDAAGKALAWIGTEGAPASARRTLAHPGTFTVLVRFLKPFDPAEFDGRKGVAAEARRRIADALSASLGGAPMT